MSQLATLSTVELHQSYARTHPKRPTRRQLHAARQHYPAELRNPYKWFLFATWGLGDCETSSVIAPAWRCSRCDRVLGPRAAEDTRSGGGPSYDRLIRQQWWPLPLPLCCGYPVPGVEYLMRGFAIAMPGEAKRCACPSCRGAS